jgi:glycosyltransferase involved in cell wall biosynthesis
MTLRVLAIRTDFKHHGDQFGYKQILKYIHPYKVIGIDERDSEKKTSYFKGKYPWLFEFSAFKFRKEIDLIHILYGEDYYRFSSVLFKKVPVVATFHQPVDILRREVLVGDYRGRIGRLTHLLVKNRFNKLAAAIVTNKTQIDVLKLVMPIERIHYIPLGLDIEKFNDRFKKSETFKIESDKRDINVITVGNWQRDWDFYLKVATHQKNWSFHLVNRNLELDLIKKFENIENIRFYSDISDDDMFELYLKADFQFLPVKGIAGSNAFLQGLALGCPAVMTNINADEFYSEPEIISLYKKDNMLDCVEKMNNILNKPLKLKKKTKLNANKYANQFSWQTVATKTIELYKTLI